MPANKVQQTLPPWGDALAGAAGALVANAAVYPLDIVKTRIQVQYKSDAEENSNTESEDDVYQSTYDALRKILADQGLAGLYMGIGSSLLGVVSTNFAYFYWYSVVRTLALSPAKTDKSPSTATELSLGAMAAGLAQVFTIPVSVITTRQQTSAKGAQHGLIATGKEIVKSEDGWSGLWRGLKASLILVINPSITYGAYQKLRLYLFGGKSKLRPWEAFVLGASAKALATIVTQPLIVAKVGLQSKPPPTRQGEPFRSFGEVVRHIIRHEGLYGLFKGLSPQITKGILVQGLLMMIKDRVEILFILIFARINLLRGRMLKDVLRPTAYKLQKVAEGKPRTSYIEKLNSFK